ncbi:hypothetical protein [Candidatus Phytoplasma sacchari]|uniref:Uncharacterized protein n=1 Tax=Candidatus Phytoplasma sacchari TaxID=2609813 RepID=A0ABY7M282_9MOLU|nr:hypothetical protein [Candidatus Phytoplasma sacchari]KAB8122795.1 hypothetical protein F2B49_00680 [Candidatus Phytoplasma sacchari]WBL31437.1 hypothetical protein O7R10_02450 [Candidatus Phytoplasma sacchari]
MRIIPYELFKYTPDLSLQALRKEFGMYDYYLNKKKKNKAMQFFLDMDRNYFNLSFSKWIKEMQKRKHYINSFHLFYFKNNKYKLIKTNFFLIIECCIQWKIKNFSPYKLNLDWFDILNKIVKREKDLYPKFNLNTFNNSTEWYKKKFIKLNKNNNFKPKNLDIQKVFEYFKYIFL